MHEFGMPIYIFFENVENQDPSSLGKCIFDFFFIYIYVYSLWHDDQKNIVYFFQQETVT